MSDSYHRSPRALKLGLLLIAGIGLILGSCGYHLGSQTPPAMAGVKRLLIELPENYTQYPRLEAKLANSLTDALVQEATYQIGSSKSADAVLQTEIYHVSYKRTRAAIEDGIRPEELEMKIRVKWRVVSTQTGRELMQGTSEKGSRFFLSGVRLTTARDNAFPDALNRVSRDIISRLSNSY